jgi:hypothetical protein
MTVLCSCGRPIQNRSAPVRGYAEPGNDAWVCNYCDAIICVDCYYRHTAIKHEAGVALTEE